MVELSKQQYKGIKLPILHVEELMKYLSDGGVHGWCGLTSQKISIDWYPPVHSKVVPNDFNYFAKWVSISKCAGWAMHKYRYHIQV